MDQFVSQLGIDWRLLLSQAVNFLIVLVILRLFVYKPVLAMLHERKTKIAEGITKAEEATRKLGEAEEVKKEKIHEAETEVLQMFKEADHKLKLVEEEKLQATEKKVAQAMQNAELVMEQRKQEFDEALSQEAKEMLRTALAKVAEMSPEKIDAALIDRALKETKKRPA